MADYDAYHHFRTKPADPEEAALLWNRQLDPAPLLTTYKINPVMIYEEMRKVGFKDFEVVSAILWKGADIGIKYSASTKFRSETGKMPKRILRFSLTLIKNLLLRVLLLSY